MSPHETITDEIRELASLYALGGMPEDEANEFTRHLKSCTACGSEVAAFSDVALEVAEGHAVAPPPGLKARLFGLLGFATVARTGDGEWKPVTYAKGVHRKLLFVNPETGEQTALVRGDPGGSFPQHPHKGYEQIYVLEGELIFDDHTLYPGDFEVAAGGHIHPPARTQFGCMLLVIHRPLPPAHA